MTFSNLKFKRKGKTLKEYNKIISFFFNYYINI